MAGLSKRDAVNRQRGAIVLSPEKIKGNIRPGEVVTLQNVKESDIFFDGHDVVPSQNIRDPEQMVDPHIGSGTGDAIFDAGFGRGWHEAAKEPFVAENACDAGEH